MNVPKPYKHQLDAVEFFKDKTNGNLFFEMGCVSKDTVITINRNGGSKKMTIAEAFIKVPLMKDINGNRAVVKTRSFTGERIGLNTLHKIIYSGVKPVFSLTLHSGKSIKLTGDHEVLTSNGYKKTEDLTVADDIMVDNNSKPKKLGKKTPINYHYTIVNRHPFGRKRGKYFVVATHRLIAEEFLNNGKYIDPDTHAVRHIDLNHLNNTPSNLLICTHKEHNQIHRNLSMKNLSQGMVEYEKLLSLEYVGNEDTYDIVCEDPHRNFIANGIVVHNCGKTRSAIMIQSKWKESQPLRTLVICPSVVTYNWKDEFIKFSDVTKEEIHVLSSGTGKAKAEYVKEKVIPFHKSTGVVIVNYEALLCEELHGQIWLWKPNCIIMDEVHYLKTATTKRSKLVNSLTTRADYKLGLTGTPILQNVNDIYGIFKAVDNGETFGSNAYIFAAKYLMDLNASWKTSNNYFPKWVNNPKTYPELNQLIYKKSLMVKKEECLDLPDLIKETLFVDWEPKQKKAYEELKKEFLTFIDTNRKDGESDSVTANLAMVKALRMLQVASGFVQTDLGEVHEFEKIPRLQVTKDLLAELTPNHKVILWCSYKHNYKMLSRICDELKIKHVFITGEQNTNEKRESELSFRNDSETRVVIANRAAGGVGINLVEASYSIVYSRNFSLAEELQSEARNHRGGSQIHSKITKIDLAIKDSIDEVVLEALRNKHQVSTDVLNIVRK